MTAKTLFASLLSLGLIGFLLWQFRPTRDASTINQAALNSAPQAQPIVPSPQTAPVDPEFAPYMGSDGNIHRTIVASSGFWLMRRGESAGRNEEVLIQLDDRKKLWADDTDGPSGKLTMLDAGGWQKTMTNQFLAVEAMDRDDWESLVTRSPKDRHVRVVQALCTNKIPVLTFIDLGLVDADAVEYGDACAAFKGPKIQVPNVSDDD